MVTDHRDGCQAASDRGVFRGHHQLMAEDNPAHVYCAFLSKYACSHLGLRLGFQSGVLFFRVGKVALRQTVNLSRVYPASHL